MAFTELRDRSGSLLAGTARRLWNDQRHWLLFAVLLTVIMARPIVWFWKTWSMPDSPLAYQIFVPIGAVILALQDRQAVSDLYRELALLFPADSPKRRGNVVPVLLGCLLMVAAFTLSTPPLAMIAFLVIGCGTIYLVYGPFVLRALQRPLGLLLLMAPVPNVVVSQSTAALQRGCAFVAGHILYYLNSHVRVTGVLIEVGHYTLQVAGPCSGVSVLFPVLALTLWLALYRRMRPGPALILLILATGIALVMNVLRIVAFGLIGTIDPGLAETLHDANSAAFTALAFYLTFLCAGLMLRPWKWGRRDPLQEYGFGYYAPRAEDTADTADNDDQPQKGKGR